MFPDGVLGVFRGVPWGIPGGDPQGGSPRGIPLGDPSGGTPGGDPQGGDPLCIASNLDLTRNSVLSLSVLLVDRGRARRGANGGRKERKTK